MAIFIFDGSAPQDPNMYYGNSVLPRDAVKYQNPAIDYTNTPDVINLGIADNVYQLPGDVIVYIIGGKLIPVAQILDGVEIFQHVATKAREINFEFNCWQTDNTGKDVFAQDVVDDLYTYVINPNSVLTLTNTFLNKIGISQLIVFDHNFDTIRGSTKIPGRIKCKENIPGNYLIVSG
jgi:hypothetical protein